MNASTFTSLINAIETPRKIVILDCCHAAGIIDSNYIELVRTLKTSNGSGIAVLVSCDEEEKSWAYPEHRHSLFTEKLLEGLKGFGTPKDQDFVSVFNVINYVMNTVDKYNPEYPQHPKLKHAADLDSHFYVSKNTHPELTSSNYQQNANYGILPKGDDSIFKSIKPDESLVSKIAFSIQESLRKDRFKVALNTLLGFAQIVDSQEFKIEIDQVLMKRSELIRERLSGMITRRDYKTQMAVLKQTALYMSYSLKNHI